MFGQDERSPYRQVRWVEIYNVGAQEIPAFGAVEISGEEQPESGTELTPNAGRTVLQVRRPTCDSAPRVAFNGENPLGANKYGYGTLDMPAWSLCSTTTNDDKVGTVKDSFILAKDKTGFIVLGGSYNGATRVTTPVGRQEIYKATLKYAMCPSDTEGEIENIELVGTCCDTETITGSKIAKNEMTLAGCIGTKVLVIRYCVANEEKWMIIQVAHVKVNVVTSAAFDASSGCKLTFPKTPVVVMSCCDTASAVDIPMYEHSVVGVVTLVKEFTESMDPANSTCELKLKRQLDTFCVFTAQSLGASGTASTLTLTGVEVGLPVSDDGTCLEQATQWVWVLCAATPSSAVDILCLEECDTGSA